MKPLYILFGAALAYFTSMALGLILFRALDLRLRRLEERLLAFVTGSALLSGVVFILCCTRLARKGIFLAVGIIAIFAAIRMGAHRPEGELPPPISRRWKWVLGGAFAVFTALYFFNAMAPEFSPDGSAYHLAFPAVYYRAHGFVRIPWNFYANISQGIEMLFLFAFAFGRHSSGALVHFSYLATMPWLMTSYGRRFGLTAAGIAGGLFFFVSPVVGMDGAAAYVDVALAAVLFALFYFLQIWDVERNPRLLIPIGILAGFSFAIKYTGFLAVPYAVGFVTWKLWRARKPLLRPIAAVAAIALIFILPWLVKNWLWMDNPVTPFANSIFPNRYVHISFEQDYRRYQRAYAGITSYKQLPWELTMGGTLLCGLFGPLYLLTPLALLALRTPAGRQLLLAGSIFALPYLTNIGTRFLIPCAPFVSIALAMALMSWEWLLIAVVVIHTLGSWPDVLKFYCSPDAWRLEKVPVLQALRIESEDSYLGRKSPGYQYDRAIEANVPANGVVYSPGQLTEAYTTRKLLVRYLAAPNEILGDIMWTAVYPDFQPGMLGDFKFAPRTVRKLRVKRTTDAPDAMWSVSEFRVYSHDHELPRAPQWRLTAQPNPWDVQLAFDNSLVTRWRSWQNGAAGMYLEIDFGAPTSVDKARLETEGRSDGLIIEALDDSGNWSTLSESPEWTARAIPVSLRRAATEELKARGIRYLLVGYDDLGSEDLQQHASVWGIKMLADAGYMRLYYIE